MDNAEQTTQTAGKEPMEPFHAARFIKEIGRGKEGARSLPFEEARQLYEAMLDGRVSDLEMGGILLAMRIKGETVEEIQGFMAAAERFVQRVNAPADSEYAPVLIPTYNGARKKANLTPLLALLLARRGVPVLVHGVLLDHGRVATAEIFQALDMPLSRDAAEAERQMANGQPAFIAIHDLAPAMARLLAMRRALGVRNSTHTLVKILQPFKQAALRLTSYTHPEYLMMLRHYFSEAPASHGDAFLMRSTEGETVASTGRAQQIDWYHAGECTTLVYKHDTLLGPAEPSPEDKDAAATAAWIREVIAGKAAVPKAIAEQVEHCAMVARLIRERHPQ